MRGTLDLQVSLTNSVAIAENRDGLHGDGEAPSALWSRVGW